MSIPLLLTNSNMRDKNALIYKNNLYCSKRPLLVFLPQDPLRKALRYYVMGRGYLLALVSGAARIDLDGNGAGEVSPEDHLHAQKLLASKVTCRVPAPEPMNRVS
jgi:ProQ/FINO family